jgi:uncharacterized membrane protein
MKKRYFLICGLIMLALLVAGVVLYSHLPERVPTHWGLHGNVNGYSSRFQAVVIMPAIMAGIMLMFAVLPALSPRHFEIEPFLTTYLYLMLVITVALAYFQAIVLWAAFRPDLPISQTILGGFCVLWMLIANVMGKVKRNFFIGIRTPWTLASERVWYATHRFAARVWVWSGLIGLLLAFIYPLAAIIVIIGSSFVPVVQSFVYYKRLERQGALSS